MRAEIWKTGPFGQTMPEISHGGITESATFWEANVSRRTTTGETVVAPTGKTPKPHMFRRTASPYTRRSGPQVTGGTTPSGRRVEERDAD